MGKKTSLPIIGGPLPSQRQAAEQLRNLADLFFSSDWHSLVLKPRLYPILIGPSGVGKTWLVKHIAHSFRTDGLPCLQLNYGEWVPCGSKVVRSHTLTTVHDFVAGNSAGFIHIDELDKFGTRDTDWNVSIIQEIYALLDNRVHHSHDRIWPVDLQEKILKSFFIIGSGTWQCLWQQRPQAGFMAKDEVPEVKFIEQLASQTLIPEELLKRFNNRPILLSHLSRRDMEEIIQNLEQSTGADLLTGIHERIDEAVATRKGIRWVEEFFTEKLLEKRALKTKKI